MRTDAFPPEARAAALDLNARHEAETSPLDAAALDRLVAEARHAEIALDENGAALALLIAFDEGADYDSPNFLWFRARHPRFLYVDRIITAPEARGRGIARRLYEELFALARADGRPVICAEVNLDPPNPGSDAFHARLGFAEAGRARLPNGKTVRYLERAAEAA